MKNPKNIMNIPSEISIDERIFYRDQLRTGRYAALADAEGFHSICFVLEALGLRLICEKKSLGKYEGVLLQLFNRYEDLIELPKEFPGYFSSFDSLFELIKTARNDAMHTGVYARHATAAAIELCIGLETALMNGANMPRTIVKDFMVKSPIIVESWQPVAFARQLMLTHSFSFLPVQRDGKWMLISEGAIAKYLRRTDLAWKKLMGMDIESASKNGLALLEAQMVGLDQEVTALLDDANDTNPVRLWLVQDSNGRLCGVLSPFELM